MPSPSISQTHGRDEQGMLLKGKPGEVSSFLTPSHRVLQRPKFSQHVGGLGPPIHGPHLTASPPLSPCSSPSPSPAALVPSLSSSWDAWHFSHQKYDFPPYPTRPFQGPIVPPGKSRSPAEGANWSLLSLYGCSSLEWAHSDSSPPATALTLAQ